MRMCEKSLHLWPLALSTLLVHIQIVYAYTHCCCLLHVGGGWVGVYVCWGKPDTVWYRKMYFYCSLSFSIFSLDPSPNFPYTKIRWRNAHACTQIWRENICGSSEGAWCLGNIQQNVNRNVLQLQIEENANSGLKSKIFWKYWVQRK